MFVYYGHAPYNVPHWRVGIFRDIPYSGLRCNESVWMIPGTVDC